MRAAALARLRDADPAERAEAADILSGWYRHLKPGQGPRAARGLAEAAAAEDDETARECASLAVTVVVCSFPWATKPLR